ncbi:MAG: pyruvate kinase [Pseudomonadota bacterium]|jgi:pyruvate kinase
MALRRTKIVATLGPAVDDKAVLNDLLRAGVDCVRLNMSHGSSDAQAKRIAQLRSCALALKKEIGIIIDLQGPKIRIKKFKSGFALLKIGQSFTLDPQYPETDGDEHIVGVGYPPLAQDVTVGDTLLLDDGLFVLEVEKIEGTRVICVVKLGGKLTDHKGLNRLGGGLTAETLTEKDKTDIQFAAKNQADYIALSFVRSAEDVMEAKTLFQDAGGTGGVIAKIERAEAISHLDAIIKASNAVMVARGDLGVELGFAELPSVQKQIIARSRALDRAVITATQMMESMKSQPIPTRAEVSDVANAVLDGTDAVMLSVETANGQYPVQAVSAMADACLAAEKQRITRVSQHRLECHFTQVDEAIAMAVMYMANHMDTKAIVALTESGSTPLWMSRIRSGIPIYALCRHATVRRRMMLYRGVYPIAFDVMNYSLQDVDQFAVKTLLEHGIVIAGDKIIISHGDKLGSSGKANTLKVLTI